MFGKLKKLVSVVSTLDSSEIVKAAAVKLRKENYIILSQKPLFIYFKESKWVGGNWEMFRRFDRGSIKVSVIGQDSTIYFAFYQSILGEIMFILFALVAGIVTNFLVAPLIVLIASGIQACVRYHRLSVVAESFLTEVLSEVGARNSGDLVGNG